MGVADLQPTLKGELVELRPLLDADFEALFAAASDPLVWIQHPEPTRYRREVFEGFFAKAMESKGALVALDSATDKVIGSSRFYAHSPGTRTLTVGFTFLAREAWGTGHNFEMKRLMLDHAFAFVDAIHFDVGEENFRSRRAVEKLGAKLHSRVAAATPTQSKIVYRMEKRDWEGDRRRISALLEPFLTATRSRRPHRNPAN